MTDEREPQNRGVQRSLEKNQKQKSLDRDREFEDLKRQCANILPDWEEVGDSLQSFYEEKGPFIDRIMELSQREAEELFAEKFKSVGIDIHLDFSKMWKGLRMLHQLTELQKRGKLDALQSPRVAKELARRSLVDPGGELDLVAIVEDEGSSANKKRVPSKSRAKSKALESKDALKAEKVVPEAVLQAEKKPENSKLKLKRRSLSKKKRKKYKI